MGPKPESQGPFRWAAKHLDHFHCDMQVKEYAVWDAAAFSPLPAVIGGLCLGVFAFSFFRLLGRPLGVSGFLRELLSVPRKGKLEYGVSMSFVSGLVTAGSVAAIYHPQLLTPIPESPTVTPQNLWHVRYLVGGLFVGFGTCLSNGCTTGHGLAGLSRLSLRSVVSVGTFMAVAIGLGTVTNVSRDFPSPAPGISIPSPEAAPTAYIAIGVSLVAVLVATLLASEREDYRVRAAKVYLTTFVCAFGVGSSLVLGGMSMPSKIAGFLDLNNWDPSLMFLMAGAHMVQMPLTLLFIEPRVKLADRAPPFCLLDAAGKIAGAPDDRGWAIRQLNTFHIDRQLVLGAATFGVGWALSSACPGPALLRISAHDSYHAYPTQNNLALSVAWVMCFAIGSAASQAKAFGACAKSPLKAVKPAAKAS